MTLSNGAGLKLLIVALALLIGMQMMIVGAGYLLRAADVGHPARAAIVEQIASASNLMDVLSDDQRSEALTAFSSPLIRFSIIDAYPQAGEEAEPLRAYRPVVRAYRTALGKRPFRTYIRTRSENGVFLSNSRPRLRRAEVVIVTRLQDGKGLVAEPHPSYRRQMAINLFAFLSSIIGLILLAGLVWASFATSRPLARMAASAERLATDLHAPPVIEDGPQPVRHLARALNKMQDDIRRLVSERTVTLAAVAHDFRTYLTRLRLRAEFIADEIQREKAIKDLDEMTALIEDTLLLARSGERAVDVRDTDIALSVRDVASPFAETGAKVSVVSEGGPLLARVHEPSLRRALANLMDNAIKYGGAAHTDVKRDGNDVVVSITDEGSGVAPDDLARLTEPFYRADASRSRQTGGAGLGLTIAKKMVEASGGSLTLGMAAGGGLLVEIRCAASEAGPA